MCTAITMTSEHFYFGRNLDWTDKCGGSIVVCPRDYPFVFKNRRQINNHFAMIGMAAVSQGYPLYFDAVNETGLAIAGLNFPEYAKYHPFNKSKNNICPYELIPWLLSSCANLNQVKQELKHLQIWERPFSEGVPLTPLHWLIADRSESIVVESTSKGLQIYENRYGILTNSPPFPYHNTHIRQYLGLSNQTPKSQFSSSLLLQPYSFGMGGIGLPGDASSTSRFIRAAFTKWNSPEFKCKEEAITQFFHILSSVSQAKGISQLTDGAMEHTIYSSCCDVTEGVYYYTTYNDRRIRGIDIHLCQLEGNSLLTFPLTDKTTIEIENKNAPHMRI